MDGILVYSRKSYSLARHEVVIEWYEDSYSISSISPINNFEIRLVNAASEGKTLNDEFKNDLNIDWNVSSNIRSFVRSKVSENDGRNDIAWFIPSLEVSVILDRAYSSVSSKIVETHSIDDLKKLLV